MERHATSGVGATTRSHIKGKMFKGGQLVEPDKISVCALLMCESVLHSSIFILALFLAASGVHSTPVIPNKWQQS
jgi:hypothetical protein